MNIPLDELFSIAPLTLLKVGQQLGNYEIKGFLGQGSSGEVWSVRHQSTGLYYALKLLKSQKPSMRQRFVMEIRILKLIKHPGIVSIYTDGEWQGNLWFVMDLLDPIPDANNAAQAHKWTLQLCDAVEVLHQHNLLHRDIKRSNVMLHKNHVVLTDFGIAKSMDEKTAHFLMTHPHQTFVTSLQAIGSIGRSAPEQFDGSSLSPATDVYAIGMFIRDIFPEWRSDPSCFRVLAKAIIADSSLRYPTPDALAKDLCGTIRHPRLMRILQWGVPFIICTTLASAKPIMNYFKMNDWEFARAGFYAKEQGALKDYTVYAHIMLTHPIIELALPNNPHGVVWTGAFVFDMDYTPQRLILHSVSSEKKIAIGHVYGEGPHREVVLVGNVDWHCTDIHGYVPFPTVTDGHLLGKPFLEKWVDHVRPVASVPPVRISRVKTLDEARALPPPIDTRKDRS